MTIVPVTLHCEYRHKPLGMDVPAPRLSWVLSAPAQPRGIVQTAYQIRAASTLERLQTGAADLWDTGEVASAQMTHIVYAGVPLAARQRAWWQVRVRTNAGDSAWSDPAWWEMGLLQPQDWHEARWIVRRGEPPRGLQPACYFRRAFALDTKPVQRARLYTTARGVYEAFLNGERIGNDVLAPGWTEYRQRIQYQVYDVTAFVQAGDNALGALVGTGWYAGYIGWGEAQNYGDRPQFLALLVVDYADGTQAVITTDDQWRATTGAILHSDLLMGERYDARLEPDGWCLPDYDASQWQQPHAYPLDHVALVAEVSEPVRITEHVVPDSITVLNPDTTIVDMGQNMVGWVRLSVRGEAGTKIRLTFGEMLNPDGTLYTENLRRAEQTDIYICKGTRLETYAPRFTFHGFRYVAINGYPGTLDANSIIGCVVHTDMAITGKFECSSPLVNQLWSNILWGMRGNFLSVPTDCPQRDERLGWMGDGQVFAPTATYLMHTPAFFTKWVRDMRDAQSEEGSFPDVVPDLPKRGEGTPAWADAGVIIPYVLYQRYGDKRLIEQHWDAMERWMAHIERHNPDYLRTESLGRLYSDWLNIKAYTPIEVLATAFWAWQAQLMIEMAAMLELEDAEKRYRDVYERICAAFNAAYVLEDGRIQHTYENGEVKGDTQTGYLLALLTGMGDKAQNHQQLMANLRAHDMHLTTGFIGVRFLCPTLTQLGEVEAAYQLLLNEDFPGWLYSVKHGATTIWERWDGWTADNGFQDPGMNSFNHYSFGAIGEWLMETVGGIDVDTVAGEPEIWIHPQPGGGLTHASAEYTSLWGTISSAWRIEAGVFILNVTLPANLTASVTLPTKDAAAITESGMPIQAIPGIRSTSLPDLPTAAFEIGSGTYEFRSPLG